MISGARNMSWGLIIVPAVAILLYSATAVLDPTRAGNAVNASLKEVEKLMLPIIAAMFVGVAVKNLLTPEMVSKMFGKQRGVPRGVFNAAAVGSILPPCPFIAYPIIKGFGQARIGFPNTMIMLTASTIVEVPQFFAGLAVLGIYVESLRIFFSFVGVLSIGMLYSFINSFREAEFDNLKSGSS